MAISCRFINLYPYNLLYIYIPTELFQVGFHGYHCPMDPAGVHCRGESRFVTSGGRTSAYVPAVQGSLGSTFQSRRIDQGPINGDFFYKVKRHEIGSDRRMLFSVHSGFS